MTIGTALRRARERLRGGEDAGRDARVLLAFVLAREPSHLYAHPEAEVAQADAERYFALVERRAAAEPLQHLTGRQEFYGRDFMVSPLALIPRPETELVVEAALARLPPRGRPVVVDAGAGSGCIGITLALERPAARAIGVDRSLDALRLARENARRLGAQVDFFCGDLLEALGGAAADLVVSNPPYIAAAELADLAPEVRDHEPRMALVSGETGTEMYARLIPQACARLRAGGGLVLELGYRSEAAVRALLGPAEWTEIAVARDLAGWPRVLSARRR